MVKLFIYGSLKEGFCNYNRIKQLLLEPIKKCKTTQNYILQNCGMGWPYLHRYNGKGNIVSGELHIIPKNKLRIIDKFENNGEYYTRENIEIEIDGEIQTVQTYFSNDNILKYKFLKEWNE
jgi:gamma-glutamylcyclotransferase (GGCT)/AIG2-like uncharacterized protein YtfP